MPQCATQGCSHFATAGEADGLCHYCRDATHKKKDNAPEETPKTDETTKASMGLDVNFIQSWVTSVPETKIHTHKEECKCGHKYCFEEHELGARESKGPYLCMHWDCTCDNCLKVKKEHPKVRGDICHACCFPKNKIENPEFFPQESNE